MRNPACRGVADGALGPPIAGSGSVTRLSKDRTLRKRKVRTRLVAKRAGADHFSTIGSQIALAAAGARLTVIVAAL